MSGFALGAFLAWLLTCLIWTAFKASAQEPAKIVSPCIAVKSIGSHGFRNVLLGGVAGALISKEQYQVVKVSNYPAQIGQKFHGSDLKTLQDGGTKVIILPKKFAPEDIVKACQQ